MKKIAILSLALMFAGCCALRQTTATETHTATTSETNRGYFEQLYQELRDSLVNVKAPVEKSESRGLLHSSLETSLAWSTASVDSTGMLLHAIGNKDSIPSRVIYQNIHHTIRDTVHVSRSDTLRLKETVQVERKLTKWQKTQMRGFWVLLLIVGFFVVRFVRKRFLI